MEELPCEIAEYIWKLYFSKYVVKIIPIDKFIRHRVRVNNINNNDKIEIIGDLHVMWDNFTDNINNIKIWQSTPHIEFFRFRGILTIQIPSKLNLL
jgi:hypothetical protein